VSKKLGMEHAVFSKGAFHQTDEQIENKNKPSTEEIENLLRFGAYALLDKSNDNIREMGIEDILKKNSAQEGDALQFSNFDVDEKAPKVSDEDFWEKILN
jgi:hypothetical protein